MLKRPTLTIDRTVLTNAKAHCEAKNISLSTLVEEYFRSIVENEEPASIVEIVEQYQITK